MITFGLGFAGFEALVPLIDLENVPWLRRLLRRYQVLVGSSPLQTNLRRSGLIMLHVGGGSLLALSSSCREKGMLSGNPIILRSFVLFDRCVS